MAIELTREQRAAVENRGGDLLVSAAAGSGKTRVLVERLMGYVEQGEDIDRFLVITFTNAAAAELRDRIASAIHARMARKPGDRHLRRNATLVYKAPICTIDAFCLDFLRQWGHLADLDPDFRLCDDAEGEELRRRALEEVLEARYANIGSDPPFAALVDALAGERDDQTLEDVVLDIHKRVQAQAGPADWLAQRKRDFVLPAGTRPEDTPWGRALLEDSIQLADYWREAMSELRDEITFDPALEHNYGASLDGTIEGLERLCGGLKQGWDAAAGCFPVEFPGAGRKKGADEALKDRLTALRKRCKAQLADLGARFDVTAEQAMEDLRAVGPAMTALLDVTAEFDAAFIRLKQRRRLIDFADGEHLTVRLLTNPDGTPSDLARDAGRQFAEIMVDEYQDTNAVQNAIFKALSAGDNLFMVGDVKQSIYRFRLAEPGIFLDKYERFPPAEQAAPGQGRKLLLSANFRSRPEVLDGVNFIFRNVMTRPVGELDYTGAEALRQGRADLAPDGRYCVELDCVDLSTLSGDSGGDEEKTDKDLIAARAAAARVRALLDSGLPIGDRPVRAEDIVLLMRSPKPVLRHYAAALEELGLPWSADGGQAFFGATEISVAIALLQVIDNPRQDVALLAALRSPLFGFTPDRLALLRAAGEGTVYDCLAAGAARGEEDCADFLALLGELRELSAEESSHRLLWHVYGRLDVPAVFAAMPDGARRRANLMALYDEACRFESGGHRGLMAFLLHLSRMMENGLTVPVPGSGTGGVRILTIHKSKGLEFPVVVLCGLDRSFNEADTKSTVLFHPELGLGPKRTDRDRGLRYTTMARDAVALRKKRQIRAEEMRLLYVAMTRAEHKLILFSTVNGRGNSLASLAAQAQCPPPPRQMGAVRSMSEWVLTPALCRRDSTALWAALDRPRPAPPADEGCPWDIRLLSGADFERPQGSGGEAEQARSGESVPAGLVDRLAWRYPFGACAAIPSKLTATQLKGREKDSEAAENAVELRPAAPQTILRRPVFEGQRPLTPAQKGTALHMVMQYLDYSRTDSAADIDGEISRLVLGQYITPQQGAAVNPLDILAFFCSELGVRLRRSPRVEREFKFSLLVPAGDYYDGTPQGEEVLLQGVVDCWFVEEDGTVTVVDFKTDRVSEAGVERRAEDYRPQLDAYTRALARAAGVAVKRRYLWFFSMGRAVEV